jgi:hypothetical protein
LTVGTTLLAQLFEGKNERQVLICIAALGRAAYSVPGYTGPALGQAADSARGRPKHNVASGGGLWGKSGGDYGATGGGVQVDATSRGVQPTRSPTPQQDLRLVEEGIPPAVDPSSMSGNCSHVLVQLYASLFATDIVNLLAIRSFEKEKRSVGNLE